jgi:hypothetical protein
LFEGSDANTGPNRLPAPGQGCYIDDAVLDAVPDTLAVETVGPDQLTPPTPVLPLSGFQIAGGAPSIAFPTVAGYRYRVVYRDALGVGAWLPVISPPTSPGPEGWSAPATGATMTVTHAGASGKAHCFYRLEVTAP